MKLIKKSSRGPSKGVDVAAPGEGIGRRAFLARSGLTMGGAAVATMVPATMMRKAKAAVGHGPKENVPTEIRRSVCTHCSVGCGVMAEVQNGVWTGQEPDFDSPLNLGAHCAKGASVREHGIGTRRLKYPMKMVGGQWKRMGWDDAVNEIGDAMLRIREESGPDSVYWLGSAKHSNEQAYLFRKFAAYWGTNNVDHQARICHSTTVAGVANTWGYGAMTNSYNDMHNCKAMIFVGSNPAEAHPVAMQHILRARENGAKMIVCDPRFTRTAAHADLHVPLRPGSDVGLMWGMLWHIFENGWEDQRYINQRVYGMDQIREEVAKWTPEETLKVTGVPEETIKAAAQMMAENRPGTIVWCMGGTQHTIGNNNTRAYCVLQLALGNIGKSGGGANIFRGHDNVQGATDLGVLSHTLPGYYGLSAGAWTHWSRVWETDLDWLKGRFDPTPVMGDGGKDVLPMNYKGIPVSRWIDGVNEDKENIGQRDTLRAMVLWGHAVNSQTRGIEMKKALEKLDLLVIIDPYPTHAAVMNDRKEGTWLLPASTQFETYGSVTASNRSIQWREKIVDPVWESLPDHTIMAKFARKLGFADELFKNIRVNATTDEPEVEDITREINRGMWTIGYTGQSPERLKLHAEHRKTFDTTTLRAEGGPADGDFYGMPWPAWGNPDTEFTYVNTKGEQVTKKGHPGTPILYNTSMAVGDGGLTFRARFGVERDGVNLLAEGVHSVSSDLTDGYPEFNHTVLKSLGWWYELTPEEREAAEGKNWKTDLSGGIQRVAINHGCAPFGNAKARAVVWTFPDPVPIHREPLFSPDRALVDKYPTYEDRKRFYRLPTRYSSLQATDHSGEFPLIFSSGRLVEYEGGGEEQRSTIWLAELQQDMFVEMHPKDANDRSIQNGQMVWIETPTDGTARIKAKALVTRRVTPGVIWTPFHFGGFFQGEDLLDKYPEGCAPYVRGDACNTAMTYGYDSVTQMQETKVTLCQIRAA
ncbi:MAG: formate dehydrogenase subunit alpha [Ectothiorhodospiraceae bacterium AqS1]|nr:formate dehydrogenase subunit alpha [Ectothiorhodospiraceae bacterium AqS1]